MKKKQILTEKDKIKKKEWHKNNLSQITTFIKKNDKLILIEKLKEENKTIYSWLKEMIKIKIDDKN